MKRDDLDYYVADDVIVMNQSGSTRRVTKDHIPVKLRPTCYDNLFFRLGIYLIQEKKDVRGVDFINREVTHDDFINCLNEIGQTELDKITDDLGIEVDLRNITNEDANETTDNKNQTK